MKRLFLLAGTTALFCLGHAGRLAAQVYTEMLHYAMTQVDGSGRTVGAGGALGALGADIGALSINPAGLGRYHRSELVFAIGWDGTHTSSLFGATKESINKSFMSLPAMGIVFAGRTRQSDWKALNVSVTYNRQTNYNRRFFFEGDASGSLIDKFVDDARGVDPNDLDNYTTGLAYDVFAIYDDNHDLNYESDFSGVTDSFYHSQDILERGSMGELGIALASNYKDRLYIGMSFGIPVLSYKVDKTYQERDDHNTIQYFDRLRFDENVTTSGSGFNVKLGLIYRVSKMLHIGMALHSPTWLDLSDSYNNTMLYQYTDGAGEHSNEKTPEESGAFDYRVRTPWRAILSGGVVIGRRAFWGVDIGLVNYASSEFDLTRELQSQETRDLERDLNRQISKNFRQATNFRTGGEYRYKTFRFRAGIGLYGSALADDDSFSKVYSLGVGYRVKNFFADLAWRSNAYAEGYAPFSGDYLKPTAALINTKHHTVSLTVGIKL